MIPKLQMLCYKDRLKRVIHKTIQKRPTSSFQDIALDLKVWMKYVRRLNKDEGICPASSKWVECIIANGMR